jgi:hypothetical protein
MDANINKNATPPNTLPISPASTTEYTMINKVYRIRTPDTIAAIYDACEAGFTDSE